MTKKWSSFESDQQIMNEWRDYVSGNQVDGWWGLVKEEYEKLILESGEPDPLKVLLESGDPDLLEEGPIWDKLKYWGAKISSPFTTRGGKVLPWTKSKALKKARAKIQKAIDSASDKTISQLDNKIRETHPDFPNMEKQEDWVGALLMLAGAYDSFVHAAEQFDPEDPTKEGTMDCESANALINTLRAYVRHQLDYELDQLYKYLKEDEEEGEKPILSEERMEELFGSDKRRQAKWAKIAAGEDEGGGGSSGRGQRAQRSADQGSLKHGATDTQDFMQRSKTAGRDVAYTKRGQLGGREETESITIQKLRSWWLPALLMAGGATAVAGHYLLSSDWFFNTFKGPDGIEGGSKKIADEVQDLQGRSATEVTGWLNSGDVGEFGPNATLGDFKQAVAGFPADAENGIPGGLDGLAQLGDQGPEAFKQAWAAALTTPAGTPVPDSTALVDVFPLTGNSVGTLGRGAGMAAPLQVSVPTQIVTTLGKAAVKGTVKKGALGGVAAGLATLAPWLLPLGIGLFTGGALLALARQKGLRSSRASMMKQMLEEMIDVPCEGGGDDPDPECEEPKILDDEGNCVCPPGMKQDEDGNCIDDDDDDEEECPPPRTERDEEGNCVCPEGTKWDEDAQDCVPGEDPVPRPECPPEKPLWDEEKQECVPCPDGSEWDEKKQKCVPIEGPDPEVVDKIKPILIRFDDDDLKVYAPRVTGKGWDKSFIKTMKNAQKQGLVGQLSEASEYFDGTSPEKTLEEIFTHFQSQGVMDDNLFSGVLEEMFGSENTGLLFEVDDADDGEMSTDSLENALRGSRGVRWGRAIGAPVGDLYKDLMRKYKKKTKNRRTGVITNNIPKVFFVFDKTLLDKLEPLGIDQTQATQLAQKLTAKLARMKKVQLAPKKIAQVIKSVGLEDKETEILDALNYTNKSGNHIGPVKDTSGKDPLGHLKRPIKEGKRKRPCTSCKKAKKKVLKESRKDDHWDDVKERWKTLSGIK